ncbi:response regulator [Aliikangiella coralliicola]|uniref:Response regulator n=1 Tax=Aliikangiella coralliicola TaxID=2592383 RepID=A0A545UB19_9GAMM|nr:response regulator [Aliikangiella coralliicola]TQV86623.1 response regulator [Aliikangiella coralliicola]
MGIKFLIVDDSKAMQTIVRRILSNAGYSDHFFKFADNGKEALERIRTWNPDMVLLDWHMPEMTGIELLQRVKELRLETRIGLITAERNQNSIQRAKDAGAMFVVNKPFTVEKLKESLIPALAGVSSLKDEPIPITQELIFPSPSAVSILLSTITDSKIKVSKVEPISVENLTLPCTLALFGDSEKKVKAVIILESETVDKLSESFATSIFKGEAFDDKLLAKSLMKALSIIAVCFYNVKDSQELSLFKTYSMQKMISKVQRMNNVPKDERLDLKFTFDDDISCHAIICLESQNGY